MVTAGGTTTAAFAAGDSNRNKYTKQKSLIIKQQQQPVPLSELPEVEKTAAAGLHPAVVMRPKAADTLLLPPSIASVLLPFTAVLHLLPITQQQVRMDHTATAAAAVARLTPAKRVAGIAVERVPPSGRNDNLAKRVNSAAAASVHATAAAGHRFMYGPQ